jgi:hypothetical protein
MGSGRRSRSGYQSGYFAISILARGVTRTDTECVEQFVRVLRKYLPRSSEDEQLETTLAMLFNEMDLNGNATIEWDVRVELMACPISGRRSQS